MTGLRTCPERTQRVHAQYEQGHEQVIETTSLHSIEDVRKKWDCGPQELERGKLKPSPKSNRHVRHV